MSVLESVDVSVSYGGPVPVLAGASFALERGELAAVVGPNGAGKSTLFKALAGFVDHEGDVVVNGEKCHHLERKSIAYIPQQTEIDLRFPITVEEVVMAGRRRFHGRRMRPTTEDRVKVRACLAEVDLADQSDRPLPMLSGGQVQRVLIARALAQEADVLLLDEAMSGVDSSHVAELMQLFGDLCAHGTAILVSTHDLGLVRQQFPRCIAVNGSVLGDGDPADELSGERLERLFSRARGAEGP
ncbi:MAG: metal ABC transporter ATP-binding protein [Actinomycetota bacterium]